MDENERRRRRREIRTARQFVAAMFFTVVILIVAVFAIAITSARREKKLNSEIEDLKKRIVELEEEFDSGGDASDGEREPLNSTHDDTIDKKETEKTDKEASEPESETPTEKPVTEVSESTEDYRSDTLNYLAIGNSITRHGLSDYWWGDWGMAASSEDKDYFHLVAQKLQEAHGPVTAKAFNFYAWEPQAHDRAEALTLLDNYLSEDLDYISIQLGENVSDTSTFEADYDELIRYVGQRAPKAKIVLVGNFMTNNLVDELKLRVAVKYSLAFIDLSEIRDNGAYQCGMGTMVYGADGQQHQVNHEGTSIHPNDAAMAYIADKVFTAMETFGT